MADEIGCLDVDNVTRQVNRLLAEFPKAQITVHITVCDCVCCRNNPDKADVVISMSGTREDGRPLEPAFSRIKIFRFDWVQERWEARLDVLRLWLTTKVTRDLPIALVRRLGAGQAGHIKLVEVATV